MEEKEEKSVNILACTERTLTERRLQYVTTEEREIRWQILRLCILLSTWNAASSNSGLPQV